MLGQRAQTGFPNPRAGISDRGSREPLPDGPIAMSSIVIGL